MFVEKIRIRILLVRWIKTIFHISDLNLFLRDVRLYSSKFVYCKKFTVVDLVNLMCEMGMKPGSTIVIHCAMKQFYNFSGTAEELIDAIIEKLGPEGTLCMPSYPFDKKNENILFDVIKSPTAAGYLAETFRKRKGVKRSLNKLHSVCAFGKYADYLINEHHLSKTCFDEKSPYYKLAKLNGLSFSLGLPKYYIGTIEHVCESLLCNELGFFRDCFLKEVNFRYKDENQLEIYHKMWTCDRLYLRAHNSKLIDTYFDKEKFSRKRISNLRVSMFDVGYTVDRLVDLAMQGKTLYSYPKFYK